MKNLLKALIFTFGLINYISAQGVGPGTGDEVSGGIDDADTSGSASGSASIDCELSDGLPSCVCLSGSISGSAEGSADGDVGGSASVSVEPGVNCYDDADSGTEDGFTTYQVDVERNYMIVHNNFWVQLEDIVGADANITYLKAITETKPLRLRYASLQHNKDYKIAWKVVEGKGKKSACDDPSPVGTVAYIVYDIINKMIYNDEGCPVAEGTVFIMPPWLRSYEMKFKSPISCGSYTLDVWLLNFWGQNIVQFFFDWTIPEGSNCLPDFQPIED